MKALLASFLLFVTCSIVAQEDSLMRSDLRFYADVMLNADDADHRMKAYQAFNGQFEEYLKQADIDSDFSFLPWISSIRPDDNRFLLLSWHVEGEDFQYQHSAYLITSEGKQYNFTKTDIPKDQLPYLTLNYQEWYGSLYYNSLKLSENKYLLFGYDASGEFENRKIADILLIEGDNLVLGDEVIEDKNNPGTFIQRLILEYSADANVNLNYNPSLKMIVHDHLTRRMGRMAGQGPANIPDGTYEGYMLENGKLKYKEKIFNHVYDSAPRPKPVLDKKQKEKDLFGRS